MTWPESGSMEDLERQSLEEKLQVLRKNREWKCNVKWEVRGEVSHSKFLSTRSNIRRYLKREPPVKRVTLEPPQVGCSWEPSILWLTHTPCSGLLAADQGMDLLRVDSSLSCVCLACLWLDVQVLNEHDKTWQTNGLADLSYEVLGREELGEHATKITVDVKLNDHWSDTVFDAPPQQGGGSQHRRHHHRPREEYRRGDRDGDRDREYRRGDRDGGREREYRREDRDGDGERDGKRPRRDDDRPRHR